MTNQKMANVIIKVLLIFGPKKIPEIDSLFVQTLKKFKKLTNKLIND